MTRLSNLIAFGAMTAAAAVAAPASAQVAGIATASPEIAIARAAARNTGYQQISTAYQAQITQASTLRQEVNTLQQSLDTNKDNQLSEAEVQANPSVVQQIQQKEQQVQQIIQPITIAQTYVLDQLAREWDPSLQQVVAAKKINLLLSPDAIQWGPPSVDVTSDIVAALDQRKPTVTTTVPAGWQPSQQIVQLHQAIQRVMMAAAQQQQAQTQTQQPAPAQPAPTGR